MEQIHRALIYIALFSFTLLPIAAEPWTTSGTEVTTINDAFDKIVKNHLNRPKLVTFLKREALDLEPSPDVLLRVLIEGHGLAATTEKEYPAKQGQKSLFFLGYGGNGTTGGEAALERARKGELVTVVLVPSSDGSRGKLSMIQRAPNDTFDWIEKKLEHWNINQPNKIKIIRIMDTAEGIETFEPVLREASAELKLISKINDDFSKKIITETQKLERLNALGELKHYTQSGVPNGELEAAFVKIFQEKLGELLKTYFDYVFECISGTGFNPKYGIVLSYWFMDFLSKLQRNKLISSDYPLGWTEKGFYHDTNRYVPDAIIVVFLKESIFSKPKGTYDLQETKIVQVNFANVLKNLLKDDTIPELGYKLPSPEISTELKTNDFWEYWTLKSMKDYPVDWQKAEESNTLIV